MEKKTISIAILGILASSLLLHCGGGSTPESLSVAAALDSVILGAEVIMFEDLPEATREKVARYCCHYFLGSWSSADMHRFSIEDAYFVRLTIDNLALANLTLINSCGSVASQRRCSQEELEAEIDSVLSSNPMLLYGKYKNRWGFRAGGADIPETEKFEGFDTVSIDRHGSQDEVLVGPIPRKPTELLIEMYYGGPVVRNRLSHARRSVGNTGNTMNALAGLRPSTALLRLSGRSCG